MTQPASRQPVTKSVETLTSGMSSIFSQISSLVQSEMEMETAAIEKRFERETIARLNERLDEPFVTVNTVTGDKGIKQAQDEYQRLMNNKSPKSKRK